MTNLDPDDAVDLKTTLFEGPPLPLSMISDMQSRDTDQELVIRTAGVGPVRLRTSGSGSSVENDAETSVIVPPKNDPIPTQYPGVNLNSR